MADLNDNPMMRRFQKSLKDSWGIEQQPTPVKTFPAADPSYQPQNLGAQKAKADSAKQRWMQDNGVDENGDPVAK